MKTIIYAIPLFVLFSCGGSGSSEAEGTAEDSLYSADHEWIVSAKKLKKKLGELQESFTEIGNKEVEETICNEASIVPYNGNKEEMNIWMMTTYMLDNFSKEEFAKYDFEMPALMIKNETPLSELNWLNINSLDFRMFNVYSQFPDLTDVPKKIKDQDGMTIKTEEMLQNADMVLKAIEDGLFAVVVVTDYLPPVYMSETEYETGYVMGYITFADWEKGELSCISPFLAQNSPEISFEYTTDGVTDDKFTRQLSAMNADLQHQTDLVIDSIARARTGFEGKVWVNYSVNLDKYKE